MRFLEGTFGSLWRFLEVAEAKCVYTEYALVLYSCFQALSNARMENIPGERKKECIVCPVEPGSEFDNEFLECPRFYLDS